jgi:hypothetical protein
MNTTLKKGHKIAEAEEFGKEMIPQSVQTTAKKDADAFYNSAETRRKDLNQGVSEKPKKINNEEKGFEPDAEYNKGMERLKYNNIDKKFQDRVNALVNGKDSTLQKDIDDETSGVSTVGNKDFVKRSQALNKFDNDHSGFGKDNKASVQFGDYIQILPDDKPAHKHNAFDNKNESKNKPMKNIKENTTVDTIAAKIDKEQLDYTDDNQDPKGRNEVPDYNVDDTADIDKARTDTLDDVNKTVKQKDYTEPKVKNENRVCKGDVFTETKSGLKIKFTGLNEDKSKVKFIDESSNKQYSMLKENFKKAIKEGKMLKETIQSSELRIGNEYYFPAYKANVTLVNVTGSGNYARINYKTPDGEIRNLGYQVFLDNVDNVENSNIQQPQPQTESKMKRLKFNKTTFLDESHALSLIPEHYKIEENKFMMIDPKGNEYLVEWKNGKGETVDYSNKNKINEQLDRIKNLMNFKYDTVQSRSDKMNLLGEVRKLQKTSLD